MPLPKPVPGMVIRYSYLWRSEHERGQEEGLKDRPCAIVMATEIGMDQIVTVLPITHSPPSDASHAVEIPHATKARLGLDTERSWVMLTEANRFVWPGPDVRMKGPGGSLETVTYGLLPRALFVQIRNKFADAIEDISGGRKSHAMTLRRRSDS